MDKPTMIRTINNMCTTMGDTMGDITSLNYKQTQEEFMSVLEDFNEYVEGHMLNLSDEDCLDYMENIAESEMDHDFEDEPTVKKDNNKEKTDMNGYPVVKAVEFLKNIKFPKRVGSDVLKNVEVRQYTKDGMLYHHFWITPSYYNQNRKMMYNFVKDVQNSCKALGASCIIRKPVRGAAYTEITWK